MIKAKGNVVQIGGAKRGTVATEVINVVYSFYTSLLQEGHPIIAEDFLNNLVPTVRKMLSGEISVTDEISVVDDK